MKNPFPGMNPFLEGHWPDVHSSLIIYIRDQLQEKLPEGLLARAEEQVCVDDAGQRFHLRPDVQVSQTPELSTAPGFEGTTLGDEDIAVAEPMVVLLEPEVHRWVEIVEAGGRVVTVVEVLSPTNKSEEGRQTYLRKQRAYVSGGVNLVEIDLLRAGNHVVSVPLANIAERARTPYLICVFRASKPEQREIYSMPLRERLPAVRIPLRPKDADVVLDLQPLVDQCYERGRYWITDYHRDPAPPLAQLDARWLDELLRSRGLR